MMRKKEEPKAGAVPEEPQPVRNPGGFQRSGEAVDAYAHRKFIVHEKPHMELSPKEQE